MCSGGNNVFTFHVQPSGVNNILSYIKKLKLDFFRIFRYLKIRFDFLVLVFLPGAIHVFYIFHTQD